MGKPGQRIVVAMSGGVDSSMAAVLLQQEGYEVIGVTLQLQECDAVRGSRSCCGVDGLLAARQLAHQLGFPHYTLNCVADFNRLVLRPAWEEYARGRTPSPCFSCNEHVKFGLLLDWAHKVGAQAVATGHYARIDGQDTASPRLLRGVDKLKDQSYFLAGLTAAQLRRILFPLGNLQKREVRRLAAAQGLPNADASESQDACLVGPGQTFAEMLRQRFSGQIVLGDVVDERGDIIGQHRGIHHFTIGQRRGIGVSAPSRLWVKRILADRSTVVVTDCRQHLYSRHMTIEGVRWLQRELTGRSFTCEVQVRYRHAPAPTSVELTETQDRARLTFERPICAVTPGQAAVLYQGEQVIGRGWILEAE